MGSPSPKAPPDVGQIEAVIRDYIQGWYEGSEERMDRALHAEMVKRTPASDELDSLREVTKARMMALTAGGGGNAPDPEMEIDIDAVSPPMAAARVVSPEYVDYLHLLQTSEGWKIVNVLFRRRADHEV